MHALCLLVCVLVLRLHGGRAAEVPLAAEDPQVQEVYALMDRQGLPDVKHLFILTRDLSGDKDIFELSTPTPGSVHVRGTSAVALASGLNWFLKYYCNCTLLAWQGQQLTRLPIPLPTLPQTITKRSSVLFRHYLNVCTFGYTTVWWDWQRWEREIDFMAINGVNFPMSFNGQEFVWSKVWQAMGLQDAAIQEFFSGPAFLPWNRMGNLQKWAGGLSEHWLQAQADLQLRILQRQRALGMTPILPAFSGHVPLALRDLFPTANITVSPLWGGFNATYSSVGLLEPVDPLFATIAKKYLEMQTQIFGTDHYYSADTYNEMDPSSNDPAFLQKVASTHFKSLTQVDPKAVWVLQGWMFAFSGFWQRPQVQGYLSGVDPGRVVVLDMDAYAQVNNEPWRRTDSFFGHDFIWGAVHDFGGRRSLFGNLTRLANAPLAALATPNTTMVGFGMSPEAIEQNPVFYELAFELPWHTAPVNVTEWVQLYAARRYGRTDQDITAAWSHLAAGVYTQTNEWHNVLDFKPSPPSAAAPASPLHRSALATPSGPPVTLLTEAWRELVRAAQATPAPNSLFLYDLVDVTRQCLSNTFQDLATLVNAAYKNKWAQSLQRVAAEMSAVVDGLDAILATHSGYLLGIWLQDAVNWSTVDDRVQLVMNARNQVTLWGPTESSLNDYATKQWAGMVKDYHGARWALYTQYLNQSLVEGKPFDTAGYNQAIWGVESAFSASDKPYATQPSGDATALAQKLLQTYATYAPPSRVVWAAVDTPPSPLAYTCKADSDASGGDIAHLSTTDAQQLKFLCSLVAECCGFNSNGWLKSDCSNVVPYPGASLCTKN